MIEALLLLSALYAPNTDDDKLTRLLSVEKIAAVHRQITARPHMAGTAGGRAHAELLVQILKGFGLQTETHSYWAMLSQPRRMTLRLFRPNQKLGIALSLNERSDPRDPDTAAIELPAGFIAYSASGRARGPIVYAGHGTSDDFAALEKSGVAVKDAILLMRLDSTPVSQKAQEAQKHGVAAVVFYTDPADNPPKAIPWPAGQGRASWFVERDAASHDPAPPTIPLATVAWPVIEQILPLRKRLVSPATIPGELELETHMSYSPRPIFNVIATIEGREQPERWVILGTHHDAWGFGGVDPGEPVAAMLELARALGAMSRTGWRPRHTVQLAFWDAGEYGNLGAIEHSKEFASALDAMLIQYKNVDSTTADSVFPPPPSLDATFGARHSIYDTSFYMTRLYDPGFRKTRALAESLGHAVLRMADVDAPPMHPKPPPPAPAADPAHGEIEYAESRLARARDAYAAGAITKSVLDAAERDLADARDRYERLRNVATQLTPAIAADEVRQADARLKQLRLKLEELKTMESTGMVARRDLEQAQARVTEGEQYLDLARVREQELTHEWELIRKVKEWEERGGTFDESILDKLGVEFEKRWGRPLPVSALGMTHTHELLNFNHTGRADVALSPDSPEGAWLIEQLTLRDIPFLVFRTAVPGKATGAHIHLGLPSPRLRP